MSWMLVGSTCLLAYVALRSVRDRLRLRFLNVAGKVLPEDTRGMVGRRRAKNAADHGPPQEVLLAILAGVSARLEAGAPPEQAWVEVIGPPVGATGTLAASLGEKLPPATGWHARATQAVLQQAVTQIVAADDLARSQGMSLARLLARVQSSLTTELELHTAQLAALTPAQTSAKLLRWLPVLGIGLGFLLGFNPLAVLLGSGVGRLCLVGALLCVLAGHYWSQALLRRALLPATS